MRKSKNLKDKINVEISSSHRLFIGSLLILLSITLFLSIISYFFTGENDQSTLVDFFERSTKSENWLSKVGAWISHFLVFKGFGVSSIIFSVLLFKSGISVFKNLPKTKLIDNWLWGTLSISWLSIFFGFFINMPNLGGTIGYELNLFLSDYTGKIGTVLILTLCLIFYLSVRKKITPKQIFKLINFKSTNEERLQEKQDSSYVTEIDSKNIENKNEYNFHKPLESLEPTIKNHSEIKISKNDSSKDSIAFENLKMEVTVAPEEASEIDNLAARLVADYGEVDPTLELSKFIFPHLDLLKKYDTEGITIDQEELEDNKNKIVETLNNYKIGISSIKATVGPTVTLYEIIPDAGIRISKIKNLEDDIALSLSALGIRIIAPIPGRGTIGIEVPNKNATIVSMNSVISSKKFQTTEMELPIALGKTINNETFVVDLSKMPHLLMAGATGQGKSVGLNAVLASLLYKKHPAEVKFVLVDPKKVELTLFNKIERHYLAKLPDSEDAIITDNTKVINTLNSLSIEMDNRYDLLKTAFCRNIKEYNTKFKARKLNPNDGHKFLPYIVLVVDEFADLIMTAGKEEAPIARLAQLKTIGIHLIIATQRPSVNVITGIIKANFPARIAFRVTSKIDSRTILDSSGADQLIGRGDMLYTQGND